MLKRVLGILVSLVIVLLIVEVIFIRVGNLDLCTILDQNNASIQDSLTIEHPAIEQDSLHTEEISLN